MSQHYFTEETRPVLGALIGLARATEGNEHKLLPFTYELCCSALLAMELSNDRTSDIFLQQLHEEKFRIVPDCAVCQSPCGRTFDYDGDLTPAKLDLLTALVDAVRNSACVDGDCHILQPFVLYKALFALGSDWNDEDILAVIKEL